MSQSSDMHTPRIKNEINWNTLLQIVTLIAAIGGPFAAWATMAERMSNQSDRMSSLVTLSESHAQRLGTHSSQIDGITYRVTVLEQGQTNLAASVEELKSLVNNQAAELRVIRAILDRVEQKLDDRAR